VRADNLLLEVYKLVHARQQTRINLIWATPAMMFTAIAFLLNVLSQQTAFSSYQHYVWVGSLITLLAGFICIMVFILFYEHRRRERADAIWMHIVQRSKFKSDRLRDRLNVLQTKYTKAADDEKAADAAEVNDDDIAEAHSEPFAWLTRDANQPGYDIFFSFLAVHGDGFSGRGIGGGFNSCVYGVCNCKVCKQKKKECKCACKVAHVWYMGILLFALSFVAIWVDLKVQSGITNPSVVIDPAYSSSSGHGNYTH